MMIKTEMQGEKATKPRLWWQFLRGDRKWAKARLVFLGFPTLMLLIVAGFMSGMGRYLIAPIAAGVLAFFAGVRYVREIYEAESIWKVFRYLFASFFGLRYPKLEVNHGKITGGEDGENTLELTGGPGYVTVRLGNAAMFEGESEPASIHPNGRHFLPYFERVQPIALEPQYGEIKEISAMTRDGFTVKIKNTRFRFQLYAEKGVRNLQNPYPYTEDAIHQMVYNRTVSEKGLEAWSAGVAGQIRMVIAGIINHGMLDTLTAPQESGNDPRGKIKEELRAEGFKQSLKERGAELLSIDIGSFEVQDERVEQQRLNTWQAKWIGDAKLARSFGEAQRLTYQEIGRAEAQAEMLISIMHALSDVNLQGGTRQSLRDVILVRTAQLLEAMSERGASPEGEHTDNGEKKGPNR